MRYETADPIGAGGMAEVFKAWDAELERHVAMKMLHRDDPVLVERLHREARAQARIDHPNVCRIYEVGELAGRPYIAMQLVDGEPLDEVAEQMSLEERVSVLRVVADAVQAAHAIGLIHRDLKPGNILVERDAAGGWKPYVVDFGLVQEQDSTGLTVSGQVLGTPDFMAPEQARGDLGSVDRRTDVYALGGILYQLLTGRPPFAGTGGADVLVRVLQEDPRPPHEHKPGVPPDLEVIALRCLEKEPQRRYASAHEVADELGRWLDGEPIEARPVSVLGRWKRTARRHPVAAAASLTAVAAILILSVTLAGGAVKYTIDLERERNAAVAARDDAEQRRREAEEVIDLMVGLFDSADPTRAGADVKAADVLRAGVEDVSSRLQSQPLLQAQLLDAVGRALGGLGQYEEAETVLTRALELRKTVAGDVHADVGRSLVSLGRLEAERFNYAEAIPPLREALGLANASRPPDELRIASVQHALATSLVGLSNRVESAGRHAAKGDTDSSPEGMREEALRLNTAALAVVEREREGDHPTVLSLRISRARILRASGDVRSAEEMFRSTLPLIDKQRGPDSFVGLSVRTDLAALLREREAFAESEALLREALAASEKLLGVEHRQTTTLAQNLAGLLEEAGKVDAAVDLLESNRRIAEAAHPGGHWRVGQTNWSVGVALVRARRYSAAEAPLRRAVESYRATLGDDHPWTAAALGLLGAALLGDGQEAAAARAVEESLHSLGVTQKKTNATARLMLGIVASTFDDVGATANGARFRDHLSKTAG